MRIVFDLDDTICRAENRDYPNAKEVAEVVAKIHELRATIPGVEIVVHTARGMASCNGDVKAAEAKNRPTIEQWLEERGIEVDEIVFGKPLGDLYVDDKAMTAHDFGHAKIRRYYGFSGANVTRIGKVMVKEAQNAAEQYKWYDKAAKHYDKIEDKAPLSITPFRVPRAYSVTLGKLYLQFIPGVVAAKVVTPTLIQELIGALLLEPRLEGENDLDAYAKYVESRAASVGLKTDIGERIRMCDPLRARTFCHGDMSLQNIVCNKDGYWLIDPSATRGMETWIMDAGKIRTSLECVDEILALTPHDWTLVKDMDDHIEELEEDGVLQFGTGDAIRLASESHIIRVWYNAKRLGKRKQEKQLARYYHELYQR